MKATKDAKTGKLKIQYYYKDWQGNVKNSTKRGFRTKKYIIDLKVLPHFKNMRLSDIKAATIRKW